MVHFKARFLTLDGILVLLTVKMDLIIDVSSFRRDFFIGRTFCFIEGEEQDFYEVIWEQIWRHVLFSFFFTLLSFSVKNKIYPITVALRHIWFHINSILVLRIVSKCSRFTQYDNIYKKLIKIILLQNLF